MTRSMPHSAKRHKSDAYYSPGREGFLLSFWIYDALIYRDSRTLEFKPLLATSWKQIDDLTREF